MADYQLTATDIIVRTKDGASIPPDMANRDYNGDVMQPGYLQWVEAGGVPDPYVEPPPPEPSPSPEQSLLYEHENRLLALEGQPPITPADFVEKTRNASTRL